MSCSTEFLDSYAYQNLLARNRQGQQWVMRQSGKRLIAVIGVSEGATIAAQLAADQPTIPRLVVIGDGGLSFRKAAGILASRQETRPQIERAFAEVAADPDNARETVFGMTYRYWSSILDVDPMPIYQQVHQPILAIMGENDESVPIESLYYLRDRFRDAGRENLTTMVVPGASHTLVRDGEDIRPAVMGKIAVWISQ